MYRNVKFESTFYHTQSFFINGQAKKVTHFFTNAVLLFSHINQQIFEIFIFTNIFYFIRGGTR